MSRISIGACWAPWPKGPTTRPRSRGFATYGSGSSGSITTCDGITRRDFLQIGALGAMGLSLSKFAELQAMGLAVDTNGRVRPLSSNAAINPSVPVKEYRIDPSRN